MAVTRVDFFLTRLASRCSPATSGRVCYTATVWSTTPVWRRLSRRHAATADWQCISGYSGLPEATQAPLVFDDNFHAAPTQIQRSAEGLSQLSHTILGLLLAVRSYGSSKLSTYTFHGSWRKLSEALRQSVEAQFGAHGDRRSMCRSVVRQLLMQSVRKPCQLPHTSACCRARHSVCCVGGSWRAVRNVVQSSGSQVRASTVSSTCPSRLENVRNSPRRADSCLMESWSGIIKAIAPT